MNFSHVPALFWKLVIKQTTMQSFFMELTEEEWREVEDQTHTHAHTHTHTLTHSHTHTGCSFPIHPCVIVTLAPVTI